MNLFRAYSLIWPLVLACMLIVGAYQAVHHG